MSNNNPTFVVTGNVRLSYAHLFTPYASTNGGDPKYSVTVLLPKSDYSTKQRIDAAIQAAVQAGTSTKWNGQRPPQISLPIHDGDGTRPSDGMPFGEECKGNWVFTASSKNAPQIVDMNLNPIINQSEVYSGMFARVSINFFAYNNNGKKGIGCGLGNVQKTSDGEPLGGRTNAQDDFNDMMAAQYGVPAQQYAPAAQQNYGQIDPITGQPVNNGLPFQR